MNFSHAMVAARAVRHKLRAVTALGAFWPAMARGGTMLARGRFREFAGKLFNETATIEAVDSAPQRIGPPLILAGHILRSGGYGNVVFQLLKGLLERGINVYRDPNAVMRFEIIPLEWRPSEGCRESDVPRLAATPPHLLNRFHPDRRTIAFTMWETDMLPRGAVAALNRCGLVLVPSRWGKQCFQANGVTVPIEVTPLGHDSGIFQPPPPRHCGGEVDGKPHRSGQMTVFGTAGALDEGGLRKNVQRVIEWFRMAFPQEEGVRLRVKITPSSPPVQTHGDSRIDVIQQSLTEEELAEWYRSLNAYVNGSFGEGFGLHLLEATACGRPLISTAFGGVSEFFDSEVGYQVGYQLVEARNAIYTGRWAHPNEDDMIAAMRQVYRNPREAERRSQDAAHRAASFTWQQTAQRVVDVLQTHGFISSSPSPRLP